MSPANPQPARMLATVVGGSGFIGRYVVGALARQGWRVRVAARQPHLAHHLQPLGTVGQIMPVQANVRYPDSLSAACSGADAVINLVAILYNAGAQKFDTVNAAGAGAVAEAARKAGARRLVHISAIGADPDSTSEYARSKAEGEANARAAFGEAIIVRPSIVFGPEDAFFNRFAGMAWRARASPSALLRAKAEGESGSAPSADMWMRRRAPASRAACATAPEPSTWIASNVWAPEL